ncbi:MAG: pentapeptide repeat-containing protein [Pleurocapsa minor HA4230-MV1]|nr:pentapeptide repeat-containing protein [Pleurocapsa minor HA4230-MV1]
MTNTSEIPSNNLLGELIKKIRSINNLTQGKFGKIFEPSVTQSTVARWEKGEQNPDRIHFLKIASLLDLSFEEFIEFIEQPISKIEDLNIENKTLTYNERHLSMLKKGARAWNSWRKKHPDVIPQLSGICLIKGEFDNLDGYNLDHANLAGFRGVFISIQHASLIEANMEKAELEGGSFIGSNFSGANLKKINIQYTRFDRAIFRETNLYKACILDSDFKEVSFEKACMEQIVFDRVDLSGANLKQVDLESAKFTKVQLREANLNQASLKKAVFDTCSVYGSTFLETNLEDIITEKVFISPQGFEGITVQDLVLAQFTCLKLYHPLSTQKFVDSYNIEHDFVKYAQLLVNRYGRYKYKKKSGSFAFFKCNKINLIDILVDIEKIDSNLYEVYIKRYNNQKSERVLVIRNNAIESFFSSQDLIILKRIFQYTRKEQQDRFERAMSIAQKILDITKENKFVDEKYIIKNNNDEEIIICQITAILFESNHIEEEIARGKIVNNRFEMIRSSLSKDQLVNLQNILINLIM